MGFPGGSDTLHSVWQSLGPSIWKKIGIDNLIYKALIETQTENKHRDTKGESVVMGGTGKLGLIYILSILCIK